MERSEKVQEVEFVNQALSAAEIALCADYRGLTVGEVTSLRRELYQAGAKARVVKNTLSRLAVKEAYKSADQTQLERFLKIFEGPTMIIYSDKDPVSPSKVLAKFAKANKKLEVKGAWLEGAFVDAQGVGTLAEMPGKEELLAKLLNLMLAPATQLVRLLNAPGTQVVRVLDAQRAKLEGK